MESITYLVGVDWSGEAITEIDGSLGQHKAIGAGCFPRRRAVRGQRAATGLTGHQHPVTYSGLPVLVTPNIDNTARICQMSD